MVNKLIEIAEDSARGGFFLFTGNALSLIILAIGSIIVARLLGPENYGLLALSLALSSILASLIDLGVNPALTRFSAKHRAEGKSQLAASMLKSGFLFKCLIGAVASAICLVFSDALATHILVRPEMSFLIKLTSILIMFKTVFLTLGSTFIGLDRMEGNALIMNAQAITKTTLSPLLVILGLSISGVLAGCIISNMIACLAGSLVLLKLYKGLGNSSNNSFSNNLRIMVSYGFPLYLSDLLALILNQSQIIILAFFASNTEIGNFSIAVTLSNILTVLIFPLTVLFPAFSKINPDSDELKTVFKVSVKYAALLIIPATVIVATLSEDIVQILYGRSYSLAPYFLSLYILTFLYAGAGSIVLLYLFSGIGQTKVALKYNLINLLVFLPLALILTRLYRVPGLITAFLIANLLSLAYGLTVAIKKININLDLKASLRIYPASFLSAIPTLIFLHLSPLNDLPNLMIGSSLFLLTYLTLTPVTGAITYPDLENFERIFSKNRFVWPLLKQVLNYEEKVLSVIS